MDADGPNVDLENADLCRACGGLCCCLYLAHDEDGDYIGADWLPDYIDLWLNRLSESGALRVGEAVHEAGVAGVAPLHDPRLSHLPTPEGEAYRATLPDWIDVRRCQFCHPDTGCLLPRRYRAGICNSWVCDLWQPVGVVQEAGTRERIPHSRRAAGSAQKEGRTTG